MFVSKWKENWWLIVNHQYHRVFLAWNPFWDGIGAGCMPVSISIFSMSMSYTLTEYIFIPLNCRIGFCLQNNKILFVCQPVVARCNVIALVFRSPIEHNTAQDTIQYSQAECCSYFGSRIYRIPRNNNNKIHCVRRQNSECTYVSVCLLMSE